MTAPVVRVTDPRVAAAALGAGGTTSGSTALAPVRARAALATAAAVIRGSRALATALLAAITTAAVPARAVTVEVDANPPAEVGRAVTFSARATGSGAITYSWNFGDGTTTEASAEPSASHVYAAPGHYAVIVIARDETGPRSASFLQTIHRPTTATSPTASSTIVHDAARHRVCNVNADNDSVSCIDTERLERTFEAPAGAHPRTLAIAADGSIWVANQDDGTLSVLDADGSPQRTIELGVAAAPFGVVTNPARDRVFVTLQGPGEVVAFDAASGRRARARQGRKPARGHRRQRGRQPRARHEPSSRRKIAARSTSSTAPRWRASAFTRWRSTPDRTGKGAAAVCRTTCDRW